MTKIKDLIGEPVESYEHAYVTSNDETNRVILILSGLSIPDDRLNKIVQRIEEGMKELLKVKESSVLDTMDTNDIRDLRRSNKSSDELDLDELFGKYSDI